MAYLLLKSVHILAVVLFVGNITTGILWKLHADQSGDPRLMAHTLAGIIRSDRWFTLPGVLLIIVTGVTLALLAGYPMLGTFWISASIALFALSGIVAGRWVMPAQKRLLKVASAAEFDRAAYDACSRTWAIGGTVALLAPLLAIVLMVTKPAVSG